MWVFTPTAMFAVSAWDSHRTEYRPAYYAATERYVQVRARVRDDLEDLRPYAAYMEVLTMPYADYAYRAVIRKEDYATYLVDAAMTIDYPSYKNSVLDRARTLADERYKALEEAWMAVMELQDLRPYAGDPDVMFVETA